MSSTRTYQAYTMAEALAAVKYDLGPEAIILSTRTFKRGGLLGLGRRTVVEVTAAMTREPPPMPTPQLRAPNPAAGKAYAGAKPTGASNKGNVAARGAAVQALASEADRQRNRRIAMATQESQQRASEGRSAVPAVAAANAPAVPRRPQVAPSIQPVPVVSAAPPIALAAAPAAPVAMQTPVPARPAVTAPSSGNGNSLLVTVPATPMSVAAKRFILRSPESASKSGTESSGAIALAEPPSFADENSIALAPPAPVSTPAGIVSIGAPHAQTNAGYSAPNRNMSHAHSAVAQPEMSPQVQQELAAIETMVGQVLQRQTSTARQHTPSMPPKLFDVYLRLVGLDVPDDLADLIINEMREQMGPAELENEAALRASAIEHLADHIPVSPTPLNHTSPNGRPLTIALVGPTGVGKTTTLAKLAASFKLKAGRKVGLITADTYRIAAVDQLRTYANIIGLPLQVALTPADMRQAVHSLGDCEVILVDTAGRSQKDAMRIAELRQFIEAAHPHEVHIVLSATAGEKVLASEAEAFSRVGVNKLILTKMDEAASLGGVMTLLRLLGKPVSFITTGQEVPDHLEPAQSQRLAELMLGGPVHE